jgi:hypothetical protein
VLGGGDSRTGSVLAPVFAPRAHAIAEPAGPRIEGQRPELPHQFRDPRAAVIWSAVFPGGGQIYNGQPWRGVLFAAAFWGTIWFAGVGALAYFASIAEAYRTARRINAGEVWFEG